MTSKPYDLADPNARSLVESLRSVGYGPSTAVADILDNSITAGAANIWIDFYWKGRESEITILDDGKGMSEVDLVEAMRPGTMSPTDSRASTDLGRFGLGLKTASFSQCRELTVWSKIKGVNPVGRQWDLDYVIHCNEWRLKKNLPEPEGPRFQQLKDLENGTLVTWRKLDRLVGKETANDDKSHQIFLTQIKESQRYLEMIFHRHLDGLAMTHHKPLRIFINDNKLEPWDPFHISANAPSESSPEEMIVGADRKLTSF